MNEFIFNLVVAAAWLRHVEAPKYGDNYASETSTVAWDFAYWNTCAADLDRMNWLLEHQGPLRFAEEDEIIARNRKVTYEKNRAASDANLTENRRLGLVR